MCGFESHRPYNDRETSLTPLVGADGSLSFYPYPHAPPSPSLTKLLQQSPNALRKKQASTSTAQFLRTSLREEAQTISVTICKIQAILGSQKRHSSGYPRGYFEMPTWERKNSSEESNETSEESNETSEEMNHAHVEKEKYPRGDLRFSTWGSVFPKAKSHQTVKIFKS